MEISLEEQFKKIHERAAEEKENNNVGLEVNKISYEMLSVLKDIRNETNETKYNVLLVYRMLYRFLNAILSIAVLYFVCQLLLRG